MPAPVRDRYLDEGSQELGRRPFVTSLHCRFDATSGVPSGVRRECQ